MKIKKFFLIRRKACAGLDLMAEYRCLKAVHSVIPNILPSALEDLHYRPIPKRPVMLFKFSPRNVNKLVNTDEIERKYQVDSGSLVDFIQYHGASEIDANGNVVRKGGAKIPFDGSPVFDPDSHEITSVWVKSVRLKHSDDKDTWENVPWNKLPDAVKRRYQMLKPEELKERLAKIKEIRPEL
jgi:hypothetical protein